MYNGGVSRRVESHEQREAELKVVEQARAESRKEIAQLEQMKQYTRAAFLSDAVATAEGFERCWPKLRDQIFYERAHYR